jgi:hypothetical protein
VGAFAYLNNEKSPKSRTISWDNLPTKDEIAKNRTTVATATSESLGIVYGADGKLDTSKWVEYRSEYGGFSVRAPKERGSIFCNGDNNSYCNGEGFEYSLSDFFSKAYGLGIGGFDIWTIQKKTSDNFDTWIKNHVSSGVYGADNLSNIQKTSVAKYPALRFDVKNQDGISVMVKYIKYPSFDNKEYDNVFKTPRFSLLRLHLVDLGDRYAIISHTLLVDKNKFNEDLYAADYATAKKSVLLDDKTLSDIYQAILDSFQAFPPTKS